MRFRSFLPLIVAFTAACGDSLTAPKAVEQMQQEIHFPPPAISSLTLYGEYEANIQVLSLYTRPGISPIPETRVAGATATLKLTASASFAQRRDAVCEQGVCKTAWDMFVYLKPQGEGEADVIVSLKANPTESVRFHVIVKPSCYDEYGNYICKG